MKINFILKKIPNIQNHQNFSICTNIKYTDISSYQISNNNNNNTNDHNSNFSLNLIDENFEFIYNKNSQFLIVDFKEKICSEKNFSLDSLNLFYLNNNNFEELNDNEKFEKIFKINSIKKNFYTIFYKINKELIKIHLDFYQLNIEKIYINLSIFSSIFMFKYILNKKFKNKINLPINNIQLYILNIYKNYKSHKEKINFNNFKEIKNNVKFYEIIFNAENLNNNNSSFEFPLNSNNTNLINFNINYIINFLLTSNLNNKPNFGLNFKFNYMKNIYKLSFDKNASDLCECSDGINLFFYCLNKNCNLYNKLYVKNLGYGIFDILKEGEKIFCPLCLQNCLELKNLGLINSKWVYKGIIGGNKKNTFEGDGLTIDEKLYIFKEAKLNKLLIKLIMDIKPYIIFNKKNNNKNNNKNINNDNEEDDDNILNDINLCDLNIENKNIVNKSIINLNKYNNNNINNATLSKTNFSNNINSNNEEDGIKYYNTESELESLDIKIEERENYSCNSIRCGAIPDENECIIF